MKRKLFISSAVISTAFLLIIIDLFIYAWTTKPSLYFKSHDYLPIFGEVKMTVTELWGRNILFFNQEAPYTGSIVSMGNDGVIANGFTGYGIYYQLIKDPARSDI
jgi:hypothetical protein